MATVNEKFADKITGRLLQISRFESGTVKAVLKEFKILEKNIINQLITIDPTSSKTAALRKKRLTELLRSVKQTITVGTDRMQKELTGDLLDISSNEVNFLNNTTKTAVATNIFSIVYSPEQIKRLVDNTLIQGAPSKDWWARQATSTQNKFTDVMRQGVLLGESTAQLTRRVKDVLQISRRNAESLARTSVQTVANQTRQDYYNKSDLIRAVEWLSTLDSRTSNICMALDGLTWTLPDYKPIGHNISFPGPTAHWGCRSTQTAILKSWKDVNGIPKGTRASMDGQVPETMNYEDWLKTKPEEFQKEVLGPAKYKLWSEGKLSLRNLINEDARPLRVKEL